MEHDAERLRRERFMPRGRGASGPLPNRFERLRVEEDGDALDELLRDDPDYVAPAPQTVFYQDDTQSVITRNSSPDLGFGASLNPYRGCEHGCAYCYARPYHEYLGFDSALDFETKIVVKERAAELLEAEMRRPRWEPQVLACSGVTDPYQPVERRLRITRGCLEVLARFRNPVAMVTKNHLVTRDIDLLRDLAGHSAAAVFVSVTTLDAGLARVLEPRASAPAFRLEAIRQLNEAGIPAGVSVAPIIPGLNDHEIPSILEAAARHGARAAFYTVVRLPYGVKEVFAGWLENHVPGRKEKILGRIRAMRGGDLNDSRFGSRMSGEGPVAEEIGALFRVASRRCGLDRGLPALSTAAFCRPGEERQMDLFG